MWICDTFMIQLRNKLFLKELLYIDFYVKQYMMEYGIDNVRGLIKSWCISSVTFFILSITLNWIKGGNKNPNAIHLLEANQRSLSDWGQTRPAVSGLKLDTVGQRTKTS